MGKHSHHGFYHGQRVVVDWQRKEEPDQRQVKDGDTGTVVDIEPPASGRDWIGVRFDTGPLWPLWIPHTDIRPAE